MKAARARDGLRYASVAVGEDGKRQAAAARRHVERGGDADKLQRKGPRVSGEQGRMCGTTAETHLQLRRIELDLKSAGAQQALFHEHHGVSQTPELRADG